MIRQGPRNCSTIHDSRLTRRRSPLDPRVLEMPLELLEFADIQFQLPHLEQLCHPLSFPSLVSFRWIFWELCLVLPVVLIVQLGPVVFDFLSAGATSSSSPTAQIMRLEGASKILAFAHRS